MSINMIHISVCCISPIIHVDPSFITVNIRVTAVNHQSVEAFILKLISIVLYSYTHLSVHGKSLGVSDLGWMFDSFYVYVRLVVVLCLSERL